MNETKVFIDLSKLTKLRKKLGTELVAKVGVMGSESSKNHAESVTRYDTQTGKPYKTSGADTSLTNGELALIHEFGSVSAGIPIRSFLRMPIMEKSKEIVQYLGSKYIRDLISKGDIVQVFTLLGIKGEQIVQRAFASQGFGHWPSVKPATAKAKGNNSMLGTAEGILIATGQLRNSVTSKVDKR